MKREVVEAVQRRARGMCEWCYHGHDLELHHVVPKGMGGRRRTKEQSDSAGNLLQLCKPCHGAAHGETLITATHSCGSCFKALTCPVSRARAHPVALSGV